MKIDLPKKITQDETEKLFNMLFGVVPKFSLREKTLTVENPTEQMKLDAQMIVDVLKREMGLPVVDREELRRKALVASVRKVTDGTEISLNAGDVRDALAAMAELMGVAVRVAK